MVAISETFAGNLDDVRAFCAVVDLGSMTQAAAFLRETKGSVSRRVARLESVLRVTLLARTSRALSPTAEGLAFHARAMESLALLDEALQTARGARTVPSGHLRVTASIDFGIEVLPDLVARFRARHPEISLELLITDSRLDLAANRVDLALRLGGDHPDSGYTAPILADLTIGLYAAPAYLRDRPAPVELAHLSAHDVVFSRERLGAAQILVSDGEGREERIALRPAVRATDFATVLRLTVAGAGIGHIPSLVAARSLARGDLVRVLPDWASRGGTLRAVTLAGRELPARVRLFREHIRAELGRVHAVVEPRPVPELG
ncbi:LysR substrate-binding domain-containing protein [Methylobacterium sp. J-068]|uniref:LysR substrate-binding domain-containing protein n=1 Tax=Methylobacterium sp. J-068 TaxID=2836649 RepID=UPI001FB9E9F7|nr:LysR substrate-binding domain-containing protein [Methylobacterium sp. J-068]MCJ2034957.1 LysR substrate-binding domain-containing protein [Methylobacterium sp. J-068]